MQNKRNYVNVACLYSDIHVLHSYIAGTRSQMGMKFWTKLVVDDFILHELILQTVNMFA